MQRFLCFVLSVFFLSVFLPNSSYGEETPFVWPIKGEVTLRFHGKYIREGSEKTHCGVDIKAPAGSEVCAAASGLVSFAGFTPAGGNTISVIHENGLKTTYLQLDKVFVGKGESLEQGEKIGTVASSGDTSSSFPHLHFGVVEIANDKYLDPESLLPSAFLEGKSDAQEQVSAFSSLSTPSPAAAFSEVPHGAGEGSLVTSKIAESKTYSYKPFDLTEEACLKNLFSRKDFLTVGSLRDKNLISNFISSTFVVKFSVLLFLYTAILLLVVLRRAMHKGAPFLRIARPHLVTCLIKPFR